VKKIRLLTPGPTPVPERLSLRMARPIVHHRSPEFEAVFARVREGLAWLYQTKQDVLVFAASGSVAMSWPQMLARPAVGVTKPANIRMVVVLPAPFGPRKPSTSPGATWKLTSSTATSES